jgi:hypothetical protein
MYAVIDGSQRDPEAPKKIAALQKQVGQTLVRSPSVFSDRCPAAIESANMQFYAKAYTKNMASYPKARGCMLAHSLLWDALLRNVPGKTHIAVFETDTVMSPQRVATFQQAMCYAQRAAKDLTFLGWCMGGSTSVPFCTHGYIVSRAGAKKLRDQIDTCGPPVDLQMRQLASNGRLSWGLVPLSFYTANPAGATDKEYSMCSGMVLQPWCPQFRAVRPAPASFPASLLQDAHERLSWLESEGNISAEWKAMLDNEDNEKLTEVHATRLLRTDRPLGVHRLPNIDR